jgi:hypothetical protein
MDARASGIGVVIPTPSSRFSQLGNVVFVDDEGSVVAIANVFNNSDPSVSARPPEGISKIEGPVGRVEIPLPGVRAVASVGAKIERLPNEYLAAYHNLEKLLMYAEGTRFY